MNTFDSYRLHITPLSPIHVGTGESYEPTNYVIEDGVLHEFDTGAVVESLSAGDRRALLDIVNRRPDGEMIKAVQRYFHDRREHLMPWAVNRVPVLPGVASHYASRIGQTANREVDGKQVLNSMEIDRTSYNPITRQPVLFGSSLKGAIRTALLEMVNNGKPAREKKGLHEFQGRLFKYLNDRSRPVLELDPMRLVQLSDTAWCGEPGLPAAQVHLAVNRKKAPVVDQQGKVRKSQAETRDLYQILECVPGWCYRAFSGQLNLQSVDGLPETGRKGERNLPDMSLRFNVTDIARACNTFYRSILEDESRLMRDRGYLDPTWDRSIQELLAIVCEKMDRGEVFLLRGGRHSGAESITLNGVRNIKIMKGKGEKPEYASAARTLWLAADTKDQSENLLPFGWLLVEIQPFADITRDWPELKTACEPHLANARAVAEKLASQKEVMEQARVQAENRRREEQEKARQRAEEEALAARQAVQREAERQERLAQMNPLERAIQELIDTRPDKNQSETSAVIGAVKQGRWQGDEKLAVARWLKDRMQETRGQWKETSRAKKPEKDREYQNTLLVISWLDGK